jgi:ligand-binding sensor domain-containing protein
MNKKIAILVMLFFMHYGLPSAVGVLHLSSFTHSATTLHAQSEWLNYQINNTLFPSNPYRSIEIDNFGNQWIATANNGILRFDGTNWVIHNTSNTPALTTNRINHLFMDPRPTHNNLWISTDGGGLVRRSENGEWTAFTTSPPNATLPSMNVNWVTSDTPGNIWVATRGGIVKFATDNNAYTLNRDQYPVLPTNEITCIGIQQIGTGAAANYIKWFGTANGLVRLDDSGTNYNWSVFTTANSPITGNGITNLRVDAQGNKWISVYNWDTNTGGGLIRINTNNTQWTIYNSGNSPLPSNNIRAIEVEPDGASNSIVWVTTDSGIARFNGTAWTIYTRESTTNGMPTNDIYAVTRDRASAAIKWFGTSHNMLRFDGTNWNSYSILNAGIPDNHIQTVAFDNAGHKWIGTANGMTCFTGTDWIVYNMANSQLPSNDIRTLAFDSNGVLWIGTAHFNVISGGVARYNRANETWLLYRTTNSPLKSNNITKIVVDENDTKWIATLGGGLAYLSSSDVWRIYDFESTGRHIDIVNDVLIDQDDNKWLATDYGVFVLGADNNTFTTFNIWNTEPHPLPSNIIRKIRRDKDNNIWAITSNGLAKYNGIRWFVYNASNSILNPATITDIDFDKDNQKWISTTAGLVRTNEVDWHRYDFTTSGLITNNLTGVFIQDVEINNLIHSYKWIASADSGLTMFRGGNQIFNTGGYISIFQHPITSNALKISGLVNNTIVDSVRFQINGQNVTSTRLAANTWMVEHIVTQNQNVNIRFRYFHDKGDSLVTRNINVSMLSATKSQIPIGDDIHIELPKALSTPHWLLTEYLNHDEQTIYRIANLRHDLKNNLRLVTKPGYRIEYRPIPIDGTIVDFSPLRSGILNAPGDIRIVRTQETITPILSRLTNYPNPFNPETTISFEMHSESANGLLEIYNILGQKVTTIYEGSLSKGYHRFIWDGKDSLQRDVGTGIYLINIKVDQLSATRKILLLK